MKCPFCGEPIYPNEKGYDYSCWNSSCEMHEARLSLKTWQALIDGKKAQDALKRAKEIYVRDVLACPRCYRLGTKDLWLEVKK